MSWRKRTHCHQMTGSAAATGNHHKSEHGSRLGDLPPSVTMVSRCEPAHVHMVGHVCFTHWLLESYAQVCRSGFCFRERAHLPGIGGGHIP